MISNYISTLKSRINNVGLTIGGLLSGNKAATTSPTFPVTKTPNVTGTPVGSATNLEMRIAEAPGPTASADSYVGKTPYGHETSPPETTTPIPTIVYPQGRDKDLFDYLTSEVGIKPKRANEVAGKLTFTEFVESYGPLEELLGKEDANVIIKTGEFLDYSADQLRTYFRLANLAINNMLESEVPENEVGVFKSIDSLSKYLKIDATLDLDFVELLHEIVGIQYAKAIKIAKELPLDDFSANFEKLEGLIGRENAIHVFTEGNVLEYNESDMRKYFERAMVVAGKILAKKEPCKNDQDAFAESIEIFYGTPQLNEYLMQHNPNGIASVRKKPQLPAVNINSINSGQYPILSDPRIDTAIQHGYFPIKPKNESGRPGSHSIIRLHDAADGIRKQLRGICRDLGLGTPEFVLTEYKLKIPYQLRQALGELRPAA